MLFSLLSLALKLSEVNEQVMESWKQLNQVTFSKANYEKKPIMSKPLELFLTEKFLPNVLCCCEFGSEFALLNTSPRSSDQHFNVLPIRRHLRSPVNSRIKAFY
jgi:predicted adenine nucleotide alpha hydrolase (AANH) superfamily ATPase